MDNFFLVDQKNEKKTGQLVDQETDQNHMDGTNEKLTGKETDQNHIFKKDWTKNSRE